MNRISEDVSKVRMYVGPAVMYSINTIIRFTIVIVYMYNVSPRLTLYYHYHCHYCRNGIFKRVQRSINEVLFFSSIYQKYRAFHKKFSQVYAS
jgi:ATP-binding cassette subfamily B protein